MNSVYIETASRIYAALVATNSERSNAQHAHDAFEFAKRFMFEYQDRVKEEQALMQRELQQHPGAVMGSDPLEIRPR